jgi:VWFA-related protein
MVIAIQCNGEVDKILPQVNKIGAMVQPLLLGQQGEAAVLAFDSRLRTLQDFTSDPDKISTAVKKIQSGSMSAHLVDAVDEGIRMLKTRDKNRRRIILLISESRDQGSAGKGRETLIDLQINNVSVYAVPMSRIVSKLTAPVPYPRSDNTPPAMHTMPGGVASTPTSVMQLGMGEGNSATFMPLLLEIYKDAKAIFKANPMEVFTKGTGGAEFSFYGGRGLEQAIERIGEELHSEYTISYAPNNPEEGGFHKIEVDVTGRPEVRRVQTRPGYWIATSQ